MIIEYTWRIVGINNHQNYVDASGNSYEDVINLLKWRIIGTEIISETIENDETFTRSDGESIIYKAGQIISYPGRFQFIDDSVDIPIDLSKGFIARSELNEDVLLNWVKNILGEQKISDLQSKISEMLTSTSTT
jgi:hypothetical protein